MRRQKWCFHKHSTDLAGPLQVGHRGGLLGASPVVLCEEPLPAACSRALVGEARAFCPPPSTRPTHQVGHPKGVKLAVLNILRRGHFWSNGPRSSTATSRMMPYRSTPLVRRSPNSYSSSSRPRGPCIWACVWEGKCVSKEALINKVRSRVK